MSHEANIYLEAYIRQIPLAKLKSITLMAKAEEANGLSEQIQDLIPDPAHIVRRMAVDSCQSFSFLCQINKDPTYHHPLLFPLRMSLSSTISNTNSTALKQKAQIDTELNKPPHTACALQNEDERQTKVATETKEQQQAPHMRSYSKPLRSFIERLFHGRFNYLYKENLTWNYRMEMHLGSIDSL